MRSIKHLLNHQISASMRTCTEISDADANVVTASRPEFGDYQANGVMRLAKQLKINPRELAKQVIEELNSHKDNIVERYELAGPGFINIFLRNEEMLKRANRIISKEVPFVPKSEECLKITVDYSSPNLAKEMHVGHLRGTIIGDAIVRILERKGHKVIRQNHVGDWGTQFGMLICHMKELQNNTDEDLPAALSDLEKFYQIAKKRFDVDDEFAVNARKEVVHLQSGNKNSIRIWEQFINESLSHCDEIYEKLNVTLTRSDLDAESKYNDALPNIISQLESKGLLSESEGAKCIFLPQFLGKDGETLPVIVQKSDGGFLYSTTDLAAIDYKCKELDIDRALYVVDARQSLHFQQVFAVAERANLASDKISLEHIAYGTMMDSSGKPFKTRSGDTTKLIELLDESISRAYALVSEKNPELDESEKLKIAEKVGIGSVKYADLSKNRTSDYIFDWSTMLSFDGNTAPYLMYAFARIKSILAKASGEKRVSLITNLESSEERLLLIKLLQFQEVVESVALDCFPNQLCNYLHELAGLFMRFYEACPIIKAGNDDLQASRLSLAELTSLTLNEGLDLLGIETLEKM